MLADYVMKSIDNLFSDKLFSSNHSQLTKNNSTPFPPKHSFNKDIIINALPNVIRRNTDASRSPNCRNDKSSSPISKSRLKTILENERVERIKSVVKKQTTSKETSPYKRMEIDCSNNNNRIKLPLQEASIKINQIGGRQRDMIKYYRQERKSIDKYQALEQSQNQNRKPRIFGKGKLLSRDISHSNFQC